MAKKFAEHNGLNLTEVNQQVLEEWGRKDVFHRSITERDGYPQFVFYEGRNPSCSWPCLERHLQ